MIDLTKAHVDSYKNSTGIIHLREVNSGWSIGVVADVNFKLDPMRRVEIRGTYADGKALEECVFLVPQSICDMGVLEIMMYLQKHHSDQTNYFT